MRSELVLRIHESLVTTVNLCIPVCRHCGPIDLTLLLFFFIFNFEFLLIFQFYYTVNVSTKLKQVKSKIYIHPAISLRDVYACLMQIRSSPKNVIIQCVKPSDEKVSYRFFILTAVLGFVGHKTIDLNSHDEMYQLYFHHGKPF